MLPRVKLYSDRSHYTPAARGRLAELLRPYWKEGEFTDEQRRETYGLSAADFALADELAEADLAVLPMTWNHYLEHGLRSQVLPFVAAARWAGRPVLSYVAGDEGVTVPPGFEDVYVVRASGFRSCWRERQEAEPVFFEDPWQRYPELAGCPRPASATKCARIGFCGQVGSSWLKPALDTGRTGWRNFQYWAGVKLPEPQPLRSPAWLRARAMKLLAQSPLVETRFIARMKYRGGAQGAVAVEQTSREFYRNIAETDYTLCVRGRGNFSKRFYETLAMGRIPVLVDTDCPLPFESEFDWDEYIIRVPAADLRALPEIVARHFAGGDPARLMEAKQACRRLWEQRLSFGGFHRELVRLILRPLGTLVSCPAATPVG